MSNLKEFVREYPGVMMVDAVSAYPDIDKITHNMYKVAETMRSYSDLDIQATIYMFRRLRKQLYRKPRTHACGRTMSWAKYAGSKQNKPKHNWSKKKRARMGWKV